MNIAWLVSTSTNKWAVKRPIARPGKRKISLSPKIQIEIIKRVPDVKSLIQFRSVSKPWKSFIESSEFIACYGVRLTQPHRLLLRYKDNSMADEKYVCFVDENDILTQQQQQLNVPLLIKQFIYSEVIGSSCGLWCLQGYNSSETEMVVIWNPAIRKSVGIVVPCVPNNTFEKITHLGFGVCSSTYDPTIVIMSYSYGSLEKKDMDKWEVGIFTLSSKTWKMIPSSNVPRESIRLRSLTQVAIDRLIYWFASGRIVADGGVSQSKSLILSFDLITHEFKEVNLPDSIANQFSRYPSISKLNESLVVAGYSNELNGLVYGVWMMGEEAGVMTSFTKLFNIKTPAPVSKVLGFTMSGEPIMETEKDDGELTTVKVYKPCSEHINDLGINGENGSFFICPYTEMLLLVDHSDCCIISNDS